MSTQIATIFHATVPFSTTTDPVIGFRILHNNSWPVELSSDLDIDNLPLIHLDYSEWANIKHWLKQLLGRYNVTPCCVKAEVVGDMITTKWIYIVTEHNANDFLVISPNTAATQLTGDYIAAHTPGLSEIMLKFQQCLTDIGQFEAVESITV